ncbi:hypothetical protein ACFLUO_06895 [Chloroflexota bacterium]
MADIVVLKKTKEIWLIFWQYSAAADLYMSRVNNVASDEQLEADIDKWCNEILVLGPVEVQYVKLQCMCRTYNTHRFSGGNVRSIHAGVGAGGG